jgi:formate hydrogenlyase subunit 3/multisubunit Na+/H+ antiporter MnhD subunit
MLYLPFNDYSFLLFFFLISLVYYTIFVKNNIFQLPNKTLLDSPVFTKNTHLKRNPQFYIYILFSITVNVLIYIYMFIGYEELFFFNNLNMSNFTLSIFYYYNYFCLIFILIIYTLNYRIITYLTDLYFSFSLLMLYTPFLFCCTNFFQLFFWLELLTIIIVYKFVLCLKIGYVNVILNNTAQNSLNELNFKALFLNYWSNFFSSIFFFILIIHFYRCFGTSDLFLLKLLIYKYTYFISNSYLTIIFILFFLAFFFKLGLAPFQYYKINIYMNIPYCLILFYSIYYFFIYFSIFIYLVIFYFNTWSAPFFSILIIFILFMIIYMLLYIYYIERFKEFLAYSSILNSLLMISSVFIIN